MWISKKERHKVWISKKKLKELTDKAYQTGIAVGYRLGWQMSKAETMNRIMSSESPRLQIAKLSPKPKVVAKAEEILRNYDENDLQP